MIMKMHSFRKNFTWPRRFRFRYVIGVIFKDFDQPVLNTVTENLNILRENIYLPYMRI